MTKKINISIPTPCHESWQDMTPVDKGRFCAACQKQVIDFTKATDREIAEHFRNNKNVCGRFAATQLNRNLAAPQQKNTLWVAASAAVVSFFALGTQKTTAQTGKTILVQQPSSKPENVAAYVPLPRAITGTVADSLHLPIGNVYIKNLNYRSYTTTDSKGNFSIDAAKGDILEFSSITIKTKKIVTGVSTNYTIALEKNHSEDGSTIKGVVNDTYGMPIPKATVKNTDSNESVQTDIDGNYAVSASEGDILEFSYVGMKKKTVTVNDKMKHSVALEDDGSGINIIVVGFPTEKRTFFGRIFHSIGNIFR